MKYETDEYIINYNECDKEYIEDFIKYFEQEKENIFKFFDIDKLNKKLIIKLYDTVDKYSEYRKYQLSESSVGNMDVDDNNYYIHMLSYKPLITRKGHTDKQLDDFYKLLVHEFVHVCHEDKGKIRNSLMWIREGIAILLSKQKYELKELDCSLEDLLNNNQVSYTNYYTLMNYVLEKYDNEYVKKIVFDSEFGKEETEKIYNGYIISPVTKSEYNNRIK